MYNFYKFGAAVPLVKIMDCKYNAEQISSLVKSAVQSHIQILIFPQLCITGLTCMDLFKQRDLIDSARDCFNTLRADLADQNILYMVGLPIEFQNSLFNCIAVCQKDKILALVPKINLSDSDARCFSPGKKNFVTYFFDSNFADYQIPFGDISFIIDNKFSAKINFDSVISSSSYFNFNFGSAPFILDTPSVSSIISAKCAQYNNACVYVSPGFGESSTNFVYSGQAFICEAGSVLAASENFLTSSQIVSYDVDADLLSPDSSNSLASTCSNPSTCSPLPSASASSTLSSSSSLSSPSSVSISLPNLSHISRSFPQNPFANFPNQNDFLRDTLDSIKFAIATRLRNINCDSIVIGVSGGVDSTLALLASILAFDSLNLPRNRIFAVSMPGFGTSSTSASNSSVLISSSSVSFKSIPISNACLSHFNDIGHNPNLLNNTFQNAQARERSQILFDLANDLNAIVIGTADLSEIALGFSTFNGDHISNYNPISNIPKSIVRLLLAFIANQNYFNPNISHCLYNILNAPISPELLPTDSSGNCSQFTENIVGPYLLIDFFIFYLIKFGLNHDKITFMAHKSFPDYSYHDIQNYFDSFFLRFLKQQFKRSCSTDGPQIFSFGFSPRNSFLMPSDV